MDRKGHNRGRDYAHRQQLPRNYHFVSSFL